MSTNLYVYYVLFSIACNQILPWLEMDMCVIHFFYPRNDEFVTNSGGCVASSVVALDFAIESLVNGIDYLLTFSRSVAFFSSIQDI